MSCRLFIMCDFGKKCCRSGVRDIVHDPGTHLSGAIVFATLDLDFRRANILFERSGDSLTDESAFVLEAKILKEHGGRENLGNRIGDVLTLCLRPGTVDRFEDGRAGSGGSGRKESHRTADAGSFVGKDVAEGIFSHHDIEESRRLNHAHGSIVDEHIVNGDIGIVRFHFLGDLSPEAAGGEDIGLIDDGEVTVASHGVFESDLEDAFDLGTRIEIGVVGLVVVLVFLAEIHASGEFADANKVGSLDDFVLERRLVDESREGLHRSDIGEESEFLTHGKESLFGADLGRRVIVEAQVADGCKENGITVLAKLESLLGERVADLVDGVCAADTLLDRDLVTKLPGDGLHDSHALFHDFRTDTIAGKHCNFEFHYAYCLLIIHSSYGGETEIQKYEISENLPTGIKRKVAKRTPPRGY